MEPDEKPTRALALSCEVISEDQAPVRLAHDGRFPSGLWIGLAFSNLGNQAVTINIVDRDGKMMSAILDDQALDLFCHEFARIIEAQNSVELQAKKAEIMGQLN